MIGHVCMISRGDPEHGGQQNFLRGRVARVGVGADRFKAEGPEPVIDDGRDRFTPIPVAPIRLAHPIAERGFFTSVAGAAVEAHAANQAISLFQCNREAQRTTGCVVLLHECNPVSPVCFGIGMRHRRDPASDLPVVDQRDQVGKIIIAQRSDLQPLGFDDDPHRFGRSSSWVIDWWCPQAFPPARARQPALSLVSRPAAELGPAVKGACG